MGSKKFTFKTEKPTGQWRSFYPKTYHIKMDGCRVGTIDDKHPHKIRFMVEKNEKFTDENPNCNWKWVQLKHESESIDDAKIWLNENFNQINETFPLFKIEK